MPLVTEAGVVRFREALSRPMPAGGGEDPALGLPHPPCFGPLRPLGRTGTVSRPGPAYPVLLRTRWSRREAACRSRQSGMGAPRALKLL